MERAGEMEIARGREKGSGGVGKERGETGRERVRWRVGEMGIR